MRLTYEADTNSDGTSIIQNTFQLVYKGLEIFADERHPVVLTDENGTAQPAAFESAETADGSMRLLFSDGAAVTFTPETAHGGGQLAISAELPGNILSISLPYRSVSGTRTEIRPREALFSENGTQYVLTGSGFSDDLFTLTPYTTARYGVYEPDAVFSPDMLADMPGAQKDAYDRAIALFRTNALATFKHNLNSTVTEKTVVAYTAEMAARGDYREAVASIPESFRTGTLRTYLSAPFLDSLRAMNVSLTAADNDRLYLISGYIQRKDTAVFEEPDLFPFLLRMNRSQLAFQAADIPAAIPDFRPSVQEAAGILAAWASASEILPGAASRLRPVLPVCEEIITSAFTYSGRGLFISPGGGSIISTLDNLKTASALISYGKAAGNSIFEKAGYLIVNSVLAFTSHEVPDGRTARPLFESYDINGGISPSGENSAINPAVIYPLLVTDNTFYPHALTLADSGTQPMWAWTIAESVSVRRNAQGDITLGVKFPVNNTHYMIIKGIEPFTGIQLYGVNFRTDPRFESYNSSGYVYDSTTKTLLLKMVHRTETENVVLIYRQPEPVQPAAPQQPPETAAPEDETAAPQT